MSMIYDVIGLFHLSVTLANEYIECIFLKLIPNLIFCRTLKSGFGLFGNLEVKLIKVESSLQVGSLSLIFRVLIRSCDD